MVDRKTAIRRGLKRYYTGKLCPKGHDSEKSVSNCQCITCANLRKSTWNKKPENRERQLASRNKPEQLARSRKNALAWRHNNLERARETTRLYDETHRKERVTKALARQKANRGRYNAYSAARNIAKRQRIPAWADMEKIQEFYTQAAHLTHTTGHKYHVDHKIPLRGKSVSGLHVEDNLQVILATDNCRKSNKHMVS